MLLESEAFVLADYEGLVCGDAESCHLGDLLSRLCSDLGVELAVREHHLLESLDLLRSAEVSAFSYQLGQELVIDVALNNESVVGGAGSSVVEDLGNANVGSSLVQVGGVVDEDYSVACAYAVSRSTGGVSGLNEAGTTGSDYEVALCHQSGGSFHAYVSDGEDEVLGSTVLLKSIAHNFAYFVVGLVRSGVRAHNDGVSALDSVKSLDYRSHLRVGAGNDSSDDAYRLCHLDNTLFGVGLKNAYGLLILNISPAAPYLLAKLGELAVESSHSGLFESKSSQTDDVLFSGDVVCDLCAKLIYLFLSVILDLSLCLSCACDKFSYHCGRLLYISHNSDLLSNMKYLYR